MKQLQDYRARLIAWLYDQLRRNPLLRNFDRNEQRLVIQSAIIGAVVWLPVFLLKSAVHVTFDGVLELLDRLPTVLFVLVPLWLGAMAVVTIVRTRGTKLIYHNREGQLRELNDVEGDGLERAIVLYYASEPSFEHSLLGKEGVEVRWEMPTFSLAVRKFLATWATLGSGGSGGLEASVALIGESLAAAMFKPRAPIRQVGHRSEMLRKAINWWSASNSDDLQTAQLCGIAAAVATLTGAPFMSAFFAAEIMYRRRPLIEKLIYSLIATLVAYFLSTLVTSGHETLFEAERLYLPPADWRYYGMVLLMSIAIAFISLYFVRVRRLIERTFRDRIPNLWQKHLLGATLTGLVAVVTVLVVGRYGWTDQKGGLDLVLSTGDRAIDMALAGELTLGLAAVALVGKMLTTLVTISSGGSAGLLIPSLYLGTMVAVIFARVFGYEPILLIVPAMTASLVSIVNVPLAAILLPVELFSSHYLPAALLALVICTLLTEDEKLYRTQRETFHKRQIVPGAEVRRIAIPTAWHGRTLVDLNFRRSFNLTVIGILEVRGEDGLPHVRLDPAASLVLETGDTIVVLGAEEYLDALETTIRELEQGEGESVG